MAPQVARRAGIAPFHVMQVMKAAGERAATGGDVLHLEVGQPATGAPEPVVEAAARALREGPLHYTDADGLPALRQRIGRWYAERYAVDVDPARVVVTTGASGACVLAFLACFDVGGAVAVARPGYPCYRNMLSAFGTEVVDLPVDASSRFQPTAKHLDAARAMVDGGHLAGLVVASPSNPTGTILDRPALDALAASCREGDTWLVSDEIYHGITYGPPATTALAVDDGAIVVSSFSKYFSMTGWRLGWLVVPPELVTPVERLAQNLTVAPPTLPQQAGLAAFDAVAELDGHVARYAANREVLLDGLAAAGFDRIAPADGAFYLWADVSAWTDDSQALCAEWLADLGVAVTPGIDFDPVDGHRFVRFSFAGATVEIAAAVDRLAGWTAAHPPAR
ncbi:MAG: aminotransferase class I/II-fold pyridoxal phosphate-dependent enzyme [Acidimicrobiales bacterium]